ncbi:hypothetical protein AVEN_131205-1 [Araneus ventricosus]|uniref:Uncharacterized protein n=1 Tax=Araneus ventricosus TaxID=182803 RepID=A0A4Y2QV88_ARAVE|nr:hypothetical protein AVEN_131205-1 [Araneus ventricosus]
MDQHYYRSASNSLLARTADRTPKTLALQGDPSRSTFPPSSKRSPYIPLDRFRSVIQGCSKAHYGCFDPPTPSPPD